MILRRNAAQTTTFDPAKKGTSMSLSNGNRTATGSALGVVLSVAGYLSGKHYLESHCDAGAAAVGFANSVSDWNSYLGNANNNSAACNSAGQVFLNNSVVTTIATFTTGDTVCMAVDFTNSRAWWRVNGGNWNNDVISNQNPATNVGGVNISTLNAGPYFAGVTIGSSADTSTFDFGVPAYAQAPPSGFVNW